LEVASEGSFARRRKVLEQPLAFGPSVAAS
jgi:hypothetical protein